MSGTVPWLSEDSVLESSPQPRQQMQSLHCLPPVRRCLRANQEWTYLKLCYACHYQDMIPMLLLCYRKPTHLLASEWREQPVSNTCDLTPLWAVLIFTVTKSFPGHLGFPLGREHPNQGCCLTYPGWPRLAMTFPIWSYIRGCGDCLLSFQLLNAKYILDFNNAMQTRRGYHLLRNPKTGLPWWSSG